MIKFWKFLSVPIVVAVCLGLMLVPVAQQTAAQTNEWGYEIQPSMTNVGFNEDFNVTVRAECYAGSGDTWQIYVDFDPNCLQVISISSPATLPNPPDNSAPDPYPAEPTLNNIVGWVYDGYGVPPATATITTSFDAWTIHFRSKNVSCTTSLNFSVVNPYLSTATILAGGDYLNWSKVVNGTVIVGLPPTSSVVSPDNLIFTTTEGENPPSQTLEVCNSGVDTLDWSLSDNAAWLSESPTSGSLDEDECEDVTVSVDVTGMEAGDYSATITITGSDVLEVPVSLHIESAMVPIPGGPANLSASALSISPQQVEPDEQVTISINVANTGGETGSYNAILYINEVVADNQTVSVAGGTSKNVIFTVSKSEAGVYDVSVAGQSGQFEVVSDDWVGDGGLGTGGIIAIVVAVIALIVALFLIRRRTRGGT